MKLEEIPNHILNGKNQYEIDNSIRTLKVQMPFHKENWAIFTAEKSDGSHTLFYARKGYRATDDKWHYFCISESEANEGLLVLLRSYEKLNQYNTKKRSVYS